MSRFASIVVGALLVALGFVPILFFSAADESYSVYRPEGYVTTVGELIDGDALAFDCESDTVRWAPRNDEDEFFYRNSYLQRDVEAWNGGDRRPFLVRTERLPGGRCRGDLVKANAGHHLQRLPSYTASGWRGRLFMHQEAASTVLTSRERTLEVARPPLASLPLDADVFEDHWIVPGSPQDARSPKLALKMLEAGRAFASLETLGDTAALAVLQSRPELALNGCTVPRGARVRLDSGDALRLVHEAGGSRLRGYEERFAVDAGERAGLLSFVSLVNGSPRRQTLGRRLSAAEDVVRAIDAAVTAGGGEKRFDVYLTLDSFYNDLLTRRLEEFVRESYGNRPLRAGITLLDPGSGRVLAAASYPTPAALDGLRLPDDVDPAALARNHNFALHPVGSAVKPFLAAAALATRPELASLELHCFSGREAPSRLLGYELGEYNLPGDCAAAAQGEAYPVDFVDFLRVSSNRYMLFLGLLAMADWQSGAPVPDRPAVELPELDRYRLSGKEQRLRPYLPIVRGESADGTELGDVADRDFFRNLRRLFGVSYDYESGLEAEQLEREYWQPVLDQVPGIEEHLDTLWAFGPVTPPEVNLAADLVQSFRQDLYTLLLGLGNSQWSNLQLAQALGRLLLADPNLRAHLVERVTVPQKASDDEVREEVLWSLDDAQLAEGEDAAGAPRWPLEETHRQLILRGMAATVEQPHGTAGDLRAVLEAINESAPQGVAYRLFAKTGTPTVPPAEVRRNGTTPGAQVDYPGGPQVPSSVLVLGVERSAPGDETERLALAFFIEGQGGSEEAVDLAAAVLPPLIEGRWPEDWLREE